MIHFNLKCDQDHEFEGWFRGSSDYEDQIASGFLTCPVCGSGEISKALMAPNISTSKGKEVVPVSTETTPTPAVSAEGSAQAVAHAQALKAQLRALRRVVEENCDNVGDAFAEEARKIHYGEAEERGIFGQATREETEELQDEGIEVGLVPWLPDNDA